MSKHSTAKLCPCGSAMFLEECCQSLISGSVSAETPEQLMRSRYTAHVLGDENYLINTWHPSTLPGKLNFEKESPIKWISLEIISTPPVIGEMGKVEFIARFKENGKAGKLHENSNFKLEGEKWFYLNGEIDK